MDELFTYWVVTHLSGERVVVLPTPPPGERLHHVIRNNGEYRFHLTIRSRRPGRWISARLMLRRGEGLQATWTGKRWIITRTKRPAAKK